MASIARRRAVFHMLEGCRLRFPESHARASRCWPTRRRSKCHYPAIFAAAHLLQPMGFYSTNIVNDARRRSSSSRSKSTRDIGRSGAGGALRLASISSPSRDAHANGERP